MPVSSNFHVAASSCARFAAALPFAVAMAFPKSWNNAAHLYMEMPDSFHAFVSEAVPSVRAE
jgi:hypothetical protein